MAKHMRKPIDLEIHHKQKTSLEHSEVEGTKSERISFNFKYHSREKLLSTEKDCNYKEEKRIDREINWLKVAWEVKILGAFSNFVLDALQGETDQNADVSTWFSSLHCYHFYHSSLIEG